MLLAGQGATQQAQASGDWHNRSLRCLEVWLCLCSPVILAEPRLLLQLWLGIAPHDLGPRLTPRLTDLLIEDLVKGQLSPLLQILLHDTADAERQKEGKDYSRLSLEGVKADSGVVRGEHCPANRAARPPQPPPSPSLSHPWSLCVVAGVSAKDPRLS